MNIRIRKSMLSGAVLIIIAVLGACKNDTYNHYNDGDHDQQYGWANTYIARGENGYYYYQSYYAKFLYGIDDENNLEDMENVMEDADTSQVPFKVFCIDTANQRADIWCYKPDCTHDTIECNGIFDRSKYLSGYIYYYDHHVYLVSMDDGGFYLEQFEVDGSNQKRICKIADRDSQLEFLILHRGYLYYTMTSGVYRRPVAKNGKQECLIEYEKPEQTDCGYLNAVGEWVYFTVRDMAEDSVSTAYRYQISAGEKQELIKVKQANRLSIATADNHMLCYYQSDIGLCGYDMESGENTVLYPEKDQAGKDIRTDGQYLFLDNSKAVMFPEDFLPEELRDEAVRKIQVFDLEGTLLKEFSPASALTVTPCFLSDQSWFVTYMGGDQIIDGSYVEGLALLPLSDLLAGDTREVDFSHLDWFLTGIDE